MASNQAKTGGPAPFGYKWTAGELVFVPHESAIYAKAIDLYLVNQRIGTTAKLLNKRGYRTRAGKEFTTMSLKRILKNPVAKGIQRVSVSKRADDGTQTTIIEEKIVPAIVTPKIWNHVQTLINENANAPRARPVTQDLFVGKIDCHCGTKMELPSKSSEYNCFNCSLRIHQDDILAAFEQQAEKLLLLSHNLLKEKAQTSLLEFEFNPQHILREIERDTEKLFKLHASDAIPESTFKKRFTDLENRKNQLLSGMDEQPLAHISTSIGEFWHELSKEDKRILVENLVDKIVVTPTSISISFFSLFNFAQQDNTCPG